MFVELLASPGSSVMQFRMQPQLVDASDPDARLFRLVVLFTAPSEARSAIQVARALAPPQVGVWFVCPVTRSLPGFIRFQRFMAFTKLLCRELEAADLVRMRFVCAPCRAGSDPAEGFSGVRSVVLAPMRWWRSWGRSCRHLEVWHGVKMAIIL